MEVINKYGVKIDYDAAVELMDDDIRETLPPAPVLSRDARRRACALHRSGVFHGLLRGARREVRRRVDA